MDDSQIIAPRDLQPISPRAVINRGLFQSVQVNVDGNDNNIVGDAANEPSIAIDPTNPNNIVIGWRQFDTITSNFRQAGYAYSDDSGETWTFPGVLEPGQFRSDPVLAADTNGDIFYYSLSSLTSVEMFITRDKGLNWEGPIPGFGGDKAWMIIDTTGGNGNNHIYASWNSTYTCCAVGTDFTRSIDGGDTYQGPYVLDAHPKWGTLDVGPDGELYIVGATLDQSSHLILKSTNAQNAGQTPVFDLVANIDLGGTNERNGTPNPGGLMGQVWVAVDRSNLSTHGNVYVLGSVDPSEPDPLDVHFIRSTDGGSTWSVPIRINADTPGNDAWQWFATMSVSPEGRIDVVWNDTRNDATAVNSELYYAYSTDAGNTWQELPVSPPFNSLVGHPNQSKIGDYYHIISDSASGNLAWSATFNGEQDIYFLRVGDCNVNGLHDSLDIAADPSIDCNQNGFIDLCEDNVICTICFSDADCDDDQFCNGEEFCAGGSCQAGADPCPDESCSEISDKCVADLVYADDFESASGWSTNPDGSDSATTGMWERNNPEGTELSGPKQLNDTVSGANCLVTGALAGSSVGANDVDGGKTSIRSPQITLPADEDLTLSFYYYLAHYNNSSSEDYLRVKIVGNTTTTVFEELGAAAVDDAQWDGFTTDLNSFAGQVIYLLIEAADNGAGSLVEAAIDDVEILVPGSPEPTCSDEILNQGEDRIDCGGPCELCECLADPDCNDSLYCNGEESCDEFGICQSGNDPCLGQLCDEGSDICVDCLNDGDCDDGLYCNGEETCDGGTCQNGTADVCNDGVDCTVDSCNESSDVCDNVPANSLCDDGLFCNGDESCDSGFGCLTGSDPCSGRACDEDTDTCVDCLSDGDCDDGLYCNGGESCVDDLCQTGSDPCPGESCDEISDQCVAGCEGDFEPDGEVDDSDLSVFATDFGRTNCDTGPGCEGDFDNDNDVDGSDFAVFAADFGRTDCP